MDKALDPQALIEINSILSQLPAKRSFEPGGFIADIVQIAAESETLDCDSIPALLENHRQDWFGALMAEDEVLSFCQEDAISYGLSFPNEEGAKRAKFTKRFLLNEIMRERHVFGLVVGPSASASFDVPPGIFRPASKRKVKSLVDSDSLYYLGYEEKDLDDDFYKDSPAKKAKKQFVGRPGTFERSWSVICRQEVPKTIRAVCKNAKRAANSVSREMRRRHKEAIILNRDSVLRGRRVAREVLQFWRNRGKDLTKTQRQDQENQRKKEDDTREAERQKKKLNFLLTQTELYGHFMSNKEKATELLDGVERSPEELEELNRAKEQALVAVEAAKKRLEGFDVNQGDNIEVAPNDPGVLEMEYPQPAMLRADLKSYQKKGMNWLINLYEQGINGILADEMGLGKTVQTIAFLSHLVESKNIWGPFLVISPLSTLHNWKDEFAKFCPDLKVIPYWGSVQQRKVIRKFWKKKHLNKKNGEFHVLISSYAVAVNDAQRLQKLNWQYLILDEAQAIKSSESLRWKALLKLNCRNRLLLTGTPIQNNMAELWALLHFVMPTLFDSHEEFYEWFSKDIENHAANSAVLDDHQLTRLRLVLKPFMLRRVKRDVESEMPKKFELVIQCPLAPRQQKMYYDFKNSVVKDLMLGKSDPSLLQHTIMRLRQVCNHPAILERVDSGTTPFFFAPSYRLQGRLPTSRQVQPLEFSPIQTRIPVLVFRKGTPLLVGSYGASAARSAALDHLSLWRTARIHTSSLEDGIFNFARLIDLTASQLSSLFSALSLFQRFEQYLATEDRLQTRFSPLHATPVSDRSPFLLLSPQSFSLRPLTTRPLQRQYELWPEIRLVSQLFYPPAVAAPPLPACNDPSFVRALDLALTAHIPKAALPRPLPIQPQLGPLVRDSGKLLLLDKMLPLLKLNGHRVLMYSQFTKMIDILEEYLSQRRHRYIRLDGSSKLEDRRDMVEDWQTKPEIFVFLLSTRAGGLGINLTAADTVIFYDSDWNPTIDEQAMDRSHRLGQKRTVSVYRLVIEDSVEDKILKRAKMKHYIQSIVIAGGSIENENLTADEAKDLLMDDEEFAKAAKSGQMAQGGRKARFTVSSQRH